MNLFIWHKNDSLVMISAKESEHQQYEALKPILRKIMTAIDKSSKSGKTYIDIEVPWSSQYKLKEILDKEGYNVSYYKYDKYLWKVVMKLVVEWRNIEK